MAHLLLLPDSRLTQLLSCPSGHGYRWHHLLWLQACQWPSEATLLPCLPHVAPAMLDKDGLWISPSAWGRSAYHYGSCRSGIARCTLAKGEWPQRIFFRTGLPPDVNFLEMQEYQNSDIWSRNFYLSLKYTVDNFQAVYWQILLLPPYGKTGSEFHLMKQVLSLCQRNPSWVNVLKVLLCSLLALQTGAPIHNHSGAHVSAQDDFGVHPHPTCILTPDGRGWQTKTLNWVRRMCVRSGRKLHSDKIQIHILKMTKLIKPIPLQMAFHFWLLFANLLNA